LFFLDDLEHLMGDLKDVVALDAGVLHSATVLGDFSSVPHNHVGVTDRVQFVNAMLIAQLIKLAVKAAHHGHHLLWPRLNAVLCNTRDFGS
jgi:hypothetical protein